MSFKPGDKVRCIETTWTIAGDAVYNGNIYTITATMKHDLDYIFLENVQGSVSVTYFESLQDTEPVVLTNKLGATLHVSASKNDKEKPDLSLIPKISNIEHAKAFMVGEKKYGRYNYTKGHKSSQLIAAAKRHLDAWFEGEENDPVDGQHHLGSVMACCSMILRQQELNTLQDDRFKKEANG